MVGAAPRARFALPARAAGVLAQPERELLLEHVRALLEVPTAPYFEDGMLAVVRAFAAARPHLTLEEDASANLVVAWRGKARARGPKLAFSAHLDHPGFELLGRSGGKLRARLHGGVPARYLPGARLRLFEPGAREGSGTARIGAVAAGPAREVTLEELEGRAPKRGFAAFDLTPGELRGTRFHGRVCDDLLGAAAILALLDLLALCDHPQPVAGIFTRAEETGFVGCQGLLRARALRGPWRVIGLECSPKRATALPGKGPVIRVGDAASVFDPALTHLLQEAAADLRAAHPAFAFQRALMDGGRCESSAYNLWQVPAGGLCLALSNYHNCGPGGRIAPEVVDWNDLEGLVALMRSAALLWTKVDAPSATMRARLERVWLAERGRLERSAARIRQSAQALEPLPAGRR